jgi:hypothetical protein
MSVFVRLTPFRCNYVTGVSGPVGPSSGELGGTDAWAGGECNRVALIARCVRGLCWLRWGAAAVGATPDGAGLALGWPHVARSPGGTTVVAGLRPGRDVASRAPTGARCVRGAGGGDARG